MFTNQPKALHRSQFKIESSSYIEMDAAVAGASDLHSQEPGSLIGGSMQQHDFTAAAPPSLGTADKNLLKFPQSQIDAAVCQQGSSSPQSGQE